MHPNAETITRFYEAFARRDHQGMRACYSPDAAFADEVFTLTGGQVPAMWHMLCENAKDLQVTHRDVAADDASGRAHWEARYTFLATGRPTHNILEAAFTFKEGLISTHRDRFNFWAWSRQALGTPGVLLGWSPIVRGKVRAMAAKSLETFIAAHPEYQR